MNDKEIIQRYLDMAGITLNGDKPYDMRIHNEEAYRRILRDGSIGLGETYMEGWWDCDRLDEFAYYMTKADVGGKFKYNLKFKLKALLPRLFNMQTLRLSRRVSDQHYDIDNELYEYMLGPTMSYTCAYWKNAKTLDEAQLNKLDLECRKLYLKPGETVLDLGCGWGGFSLYAAKHYDVKIVAVNIAKNNIDYLNANKGDLPIETYVCDYRNVDKYNPRKKKFDKVLAVGMLPHVGYKNHRMLFEVMRGNLKDEGLAFIHSVGSNITMHRADPWTDKYIFPNGVAPSIRQIGTALERLFIMEDWHNYSRDYDYTLSAWHDNLSKHWELLSERYDKKFYLMWKYFLLFCAGMYRARGLQLWEFVLSPYGVPDGYVAVR